MSRFRLSTLVFLFAAFLGTGFFLAHPVLAQSQAMTTLADFGAEAGFTSQAPLPVIIARLIRTVLSFLGIVVLCFVLYGGFVWMTAGGNADRVKTAKRILVNAVIGLVIILSSFAITQFVLGALTSSIGGGRITTGGSGGSGGYTDASGTSQAFLLESVNTDCSESVQNFQIQLAFSKAVRAGSVEDGGIIVETAGGTVVEGTVAVRGKTVTFTPDQICEENSALRCFEADTDYILTVDPAVVKAASGSTLACSLDYPCSFEFHTGTALDATAPSAVTIDAPEDGSNVIIGDIEALWATTEDDVGVSTVEFSVDGEEVFTAGIAHTSQGRLAEENSFSTDDTEWDTAGTVPGQTYAISAVGLDCAGNTTSATRVRVTVRPATCGNAVQDTDLGETGVDCGGSSTNESYCGACDGGACQSNGQCASGVCEEGVCVSIPEISDVSPGDGAQGNYVTISGSGFGTEAGTIFFGTEEASVKTGALACGGVTQWTDEQIVVAVPDGAQDGPVSVYTALGEVDATDDAFGPSLSDFDVNAIVRPGICSVLDANTGLSRTTSESRVEVSGTQFGDAQSTSKVYFTQYEADTYLDWASDLLSVVVPLVNARAYRAQVFTGDYQCVAANGESTGVICATDAECNTDAGESCMTGQCSEYGGFCNTDADCVEGEESCASLRQGSNKVTLTVTSVTSDEPPVLSYVDSGWTTCEDGTRCAEGDSCSDGSSCTAASNWGPSGQYVTLYGNGFGTAAGTVYFTNGTGSANDGVKAVGSLDFPEACGDDAWHDNRITVRVPDAYTNDAEIEFGAHALYVVRAEDGSVSESLEFNIVDDVPGPSICAVDPSAGPPGTRVDIIGDNLEADDGRVLFTPSVDTSFDVWNNQSIENALVPPAAETGPLTLLTRSGYTSNSVDFTVGSCTDEPSICTEGTECCADGTCSVSCETVVADAHYAYFFSTGEIPETPRVLVYCGDADDDGDPDGVSPSPWNGWSAAEDVCVDAAVRAEFSMSMDPATITDTTVLVEACVGTGVDPCAARESVSGALDVGRSFFAWYPEVDFEPSTTYQVTLKGGETAGVIRSFEGVAMGEDYSWQFTTAATDAACEIGAVYTSPASYTATDKNERITYLAQPVSAGDSCVVLACTDTNWTWDSDHDGAVLDDTRTNGVCTNTVTAVEETGSREPATITATVDAPALPSDTAELIIDFTDPEVSSYWPNCEAACVEAGIGVTFNTQMDPVTLSTSTVSLFRCEDAICEDGLVEESISGLVYSETDPVAPALIVNHNTLLPNTYYRLSFSEDVLSSSGVSLAKNDSDCTESGSACIFKTSSASEACLVDRVALRPEEALMSYVGERQAFDAIAYGQPDDCSPAGQILDWSVATWSGWDAQDIPDRVSDADVAFMLPNPSDEGELALSSEWAPGCSSSCLYTGSTIQENQSVCGDRVIETGEECDDGGTSDGDGCSSVCLREGAEGSYGTCGNGTVERGSDGEGEDCDGGTACTSSCLNRGTSALSRTHAQCGDGTIDYASSTGGEDCDDGNNDSFDGCSSQCLSEGSIPEGDVYSVCGDGVVDDKFGEECDDGDTDNGDGCSAWCVREGDAGSYGTCGNGRVEQGIYGEGEDCDGSEGCTDTCLWAGSSYQYASASFCGDGEVGTGEECEVSDMGSARVGPYGIAEVATTAVQEVDEATGYAYSVVSVDAAGKTGNADLLMQCSCETDAACGDTAGLGCGMSGCCFERYEQLAAVPLSGTSDVCRNASIWVSFDQIIDQDSLDPSLDTDGSGVVDPDEYTPATYLQLVSFNGVDVEGSCPTEARAAGYIDTTISSESVVVAPRGIFARAWHWVSSRVARLFGREVNAATTTVCLVPVTFGVEEISSEGTDSSFPGSKVRYHYDELLLENAEYVLVRKGDTDITDGVDEGVLSIYGVGDDDAVTEATRFTTGTDICTLDVVELEDLGRVESLENALEDASPGFFTRKNEEHRLQGAAYAVRRGSLEEIEPTTSYDWSWSGGSSLEDDTEEDVVGTGAIEEDVTQRSATAAGRNGTETLVMQATITADDLNSPSTVGESVLGDLSVRALLCENTWPDVDAYPYVEGDLNYTFSYCRDAGEDGMTDDLPELSAVEVPNPLKGIYKEFLYQVEGTGDALGVRVISNPEYLPPDAWYREQGFSGNPVSYEVDGYEAVRDGNTLYVATANQTDGSIYPNIVVLSWNEDASSESQEIFDQILETWSFNANTDEVSDRNLCTIDGAYPTDAEGNLYACTWDGDCAVAGEEAVCDAEKAKLRRDTRRLSDLVRMQETLSSSRTGIPALASGSYLRAFSVSAWPSWISALGNTVGVALPEDPVNAFRDCPEGTASDTCFNGTSSTFSCPVGSYVYGYRAIGTESYKLYAVLEHDAADWVYDIDGESADASELIVEYADYDGPGSLADGFTSSPEFCDGSTYGESGVCGDGIVGSGEDCEIGDTFTQSCTTEDGTAGVQTYACTSTCEDDASEADLGVCTPYACGNGVVEGAEECDDGAANGSYGACGDDCTYTGTFSCGDGYLAGGEACDCGRTGDFTDILADSESWASLNGCTAANGQYTDGTGVSCAFDCSVPGLSCGDEEVNGAEECDGGYESWAGALCNDGTTCTSDSDCSSGACGDGGAACGSAPICVGGTQDGKACDTLLTTRGCAIGGGSCSSATYDLARYRTCEEPSSANACEWDSWSSCLGGDQICGNGVIEGDEPCDDGNDSNNDACLNTCEANTCGDDYVYAGVESCDDGENNGEACDPAYDSSCNSCSLTCQYQTTSGSFCGDGNRDAGEACDGADVPYTLFNVTPGGTRTTAGECQVAGRTEDIEGVEYHCRSVGVCNGGAYNGEPCTIGDTPTKGLFGATSADDTASCGTGGECVAPVCADDCSGSCPSSYETVSLSVLSEAAGAVESESVDLYSYLSGETPNNAALFVPACRVGTRITGDVSLDNVVPPSVDVVFVTDLSGSMQYCVDGSTTGCTAADGNRRIDYVVEATVDSIDALLGAYAGSGGQMRIGLVSFGSTYTDGSTTDLSLSTNREDLIDTVESYLTLDMGRTPTLAGLQRGVELVDRATDAADVQIVVLLSDGDPTNDGENKVCVDTGVCVEEIADYVSSISSDVRIFTAGIADAVTQEDLVGYMAHFSSDTCGTDYANPDDCEPNEETLVEYAYQADDADEVAAMYEAILNAILNVNVAFTTSVGGTATVTSGTVLEGSDMTLPFPEGFNCTGSSFTIPFNLSFNGTGTAAISDLQMTYCPN